MPTLRLAAPSAPRALLPRLLVVAAVLGVLWLGRDVLAPLALALLLTIALAPVAAALERLRVPRLLAVLLVLLGVVAVLAGVAWVVATQALALAAELPGYEGTLRAKLESLTASSGPIQDAMELFKRLGAALGPPQAPPAQVVAVAAGASSPLATLLAALHVVVAPAATMLLALLLMGFLLVYREDLRDRVLRLAGTREMHRTTQAMLDAADRVGRFLLMQVAMNATFGASMGAGLWLLGLPNAPLWGALCFALRFIPYLGAPLSVLFPLALAFAITDGWWTVLGVVALFVVVDVAITYVLEPQIYGRSIGVTPFALLVSTAVWAVLWGPLGLVLAPALTAGAVILGRHAPGFGFLDVLLGTAAPLPREARFYQRLLAGDAEGTEALLDEAAAEEGEAAALDTLVLPAIARLEAARGTADFTPAFGLRAARTLLRALEERAEDAEPPAIAVRGAAGALDRAGAAAVALALAQAGHAVTTEERAAELVVLVLAGGAGAGRLWRARRAAQALAPRVLVLALTPGAREALRGAGPVLDGLPALLEATEPLLAAREEVEA